MALPGKKMIATILFCCAGSALADNHTTDNLFYSGLDYGSESQFGGLNVFINTGFVVSGRYTSPYIFDDINYGKNFKIVAQSFTNQSGTVRENGGTTRLIEEFNPFDPSGRFLPNFGLHFLGEGMLSRKLEESYRARGYSHPKLAAIATVVSSQLMNESVEADMPWYDPVDSMADIYWNIAGIAAFSSDTFARHFSNDVTNLYYWPGQPVIDIRDGALYNQGESYLLRTGRGKLKFALAMGLPINGIGVSYTANHYDNFTLLFGTDFALPRTSWQQPVPSENEGGNDVIFSLAIPSVQLHWDRQGSLMASLLLGKASQCDDGTRPFKNNHGQTTCTNPLAKSETRDHFSLNLYPFDLGPVTLAGYIISSELGGSSVGITFSYPPVSIGRRYD